MATGELVHVSVLFRHGHRSPITLLPSQNFTVGNTWTDGLGQLTNIGKQNEFELGQFLRKRYDSLLGPRYNSSEHWARSTDMDRTLMSAQTCLAGLFPPLGDQQWNPQLPWQPIPVHTKPQTEDWLLAAPEYPCPERDRQFELMRVDPNRLAFYAPFAAFLARLSSGAGMPVTPDSGHSVFDTLWINRVANLPAPAWLNVSADSDDWRQLVTVSSFFWREYSWTDSLNSFGSGVLLDNVLRTLTDISVGQPPSLGRKLRLYSDHDSTVGSMLAALGNRDLVWPNFASALMFELHSLGGSGGGGGGFAVQVWYRNDTTRSPLLIRLPGCTQGDDFCPLDSVVKGLAHLRLTAQQLVMKCQTGGHGGGFWPLDSRMTVALAAGCSLLACLCLVTLAAFCCYRPKGRSAVIYRSLNDVEG